MSNKIDQRIVEMSFENAKFEKGIHQSKNSLKDFSDALNQMGTGREFQGLESSIGSVSKSFSVFEQIGIGALRRIGESAINMSANFLKNMTSSLREGGKKRALNIEQAKFQFEGLGMDVEKTMADASYAVDGTAYSLDAAAKVASQLGASGLRAGEQMRASLRAVSGVAAMAGSSYEDIGNVFTKVAGQGRLMGDDLLRLSSRGINAAATLAKEMNTTEAAVREMVTKGKVDFHMFSKAMDSAFGEHATAANKTFTGSLSNMRSALARIGEKFYTPFHKNLIEPFNALRVVINSANKALDPMFDRMTKFMEVASGGFVAQLTDDESSLKNVFQGINNILVALLKPIHAVTQAFDQIFPAKTKQEWFTITKTFKDFTSQLIISDKNAKNIKRTFAGLFAVIDLGVTAVKVLSRGLLELLGVFVPVGDGLFSTFTAVTAKIGDFLVLVNHVVKSSGVFEYTLLGVRIAALLLRNTLTTVVNGVGEFIQGLKNAENPLLYIEETLGKVFVNLSDNIKMGVKMLSTNFVNALSFVQKFIQGDFAPSSEGAFGNLLSILQTIVNYVVTEAINGFKSLSDVISNLDLNKIASFVISGFLLSFVYQLNQLSKSITDFVGTATGIMKAVKTKLEPSVNKIRDLTILFGTLAGSLWLLSNIPYDNLKNGLIGLAGAIGMFVFAYAGLQAVGIIATRLLKGQKMAKTAFELVTLAAGLALMVGSLKVIASVKQEDVWRAVGVLGTILTFLTAYQLAIVAIGLIPNASKLSVSIAGMAAGTLGLITAIKLINTISQGDIESGMVKIMSILVVIGLIQGLFSFAAKIGASNTLTTSILGMAGGVLALIMAIKLIGNISKEDIDSGMGKITSILAVLAMIQLLFAVTAKIGGGEKLSTSILAIAGSVLVLMGLIKIINIWSREEITAGLGKIIQIMTVLSVIQLAFTLINTIGDGKIASSILSMTGAMIAMTALIGVLNIYNEDQINHGVIAIAKMAGVLAGIQIFSAIAARIGKNGKLVGSLLSVTMLLATMGGIIAILSVIPSDALDAASNAMIKGAAAIGVLILALSKFMENTKDSSIQMIAMGASLLVFALAIRTMADPIIALSKIDFSGLAAGVLTVGALVGIFTGFAILTDKLNVSAVSLFSLTGALIGFGAALIVMAVPMKEMSTIDPQRMWNTVGAFTALLAVFTAIGFFNQTGGIAIGMVTAAVGVAAFGASLIVVTGALTLAGLAFKLGAEAISILVDSFKTLVDTVADNRETLVSDFAILGEAIATGIFIGIKTFFTNAKSELDNIWASIRNSIKEFFGIHSPSTVMAEIGENLSAGLVVGINRGVKDAVESAKNMASNLIDAVKKKFDSHSPSRVFATIGGWCTKGLADGITKETKTAVKAGNQMAGNVEEAVRDSLGVHSLSEKFSTIGKWIPKSLEEGIQNGKKSLVNKAKDLGVDTGNLTAEGVVKGLSNKEGVVSSGLSTILDVLQGNTTIKEAAKSVGLDLTDTFQSTLSNSKTGLGGTKTKAVIKTEFEKLQAALDESKFYSQLSLDQELKAYEEIRKVGKLSAEERVKVNREIYTLNKSIYDAQMAYIDGMAKANKENATAKKNQEKKYQEDITRIETNAEEERKKAREQYAKDQASINAKLLSDIEAQNKAYEDAVKSRADAIYNSYGLFGAVEEDEAVSGDVLLKNLKDQEAALKDWQSSLDALQARGIDENLFKEIQDMGPSSKAQIKGLLELTDQQLDEYVALYQNKYAFARGKAELELTGLKESTALAIQDLNHQAAIDLSNLEKEFSSAMSNINIKMEEDLEELKTTTTAIFDALLEGLSAKFEELAANFNATMRNINGMTEEQYNELILQNETKLKELNTDAKASMGEFQDILALAGGNSAGNFNDKLSGLQTDLKTNLMGVNTVSKKQLSKTEETFSSTGANVSATMDESGKKIIVDADKNATILNQNTSKSLNTLSTNVTQQLDSIVNTFSSSGYNAAMGFANGIRDGIYLAEIAARAMALAAKRAAEAALEERSPSRVFNRIGRFVSEGFANGISEYAGQAIDSAKQMAEGPIAFISKAIAELENLMDEDLEFEPVITPVLDLSNIKSNSLSKLFPTPQYSLAQESTKTAQETIQNGRNSRVTETESVTSNTTKEGNSYQIIQNNYSPKALDRLDIYRDTRNLLFEFKTLVGD